MTPCCAHGRVCCSFPDATTSLITAPIPSRLLFWPTRRMSSHLASCWMEEPEGLQSAARGLEFGKPAAFLLQQVILHSARAFGCFENVFPLCSTFAEQNRVTFRRFR